MTATKPNRTRLVLERVLRTVAWLGLATAMYLASRPAGLRDRRASVLRWSASDLADSTATVLTTALVREIVSASGDTQPRRVNVELTAVPSQRARAMLGAVVGADVSVHWIDRTQASGLALSATTVAGPSGAVDVRVVGAPSSLPLVLRDAGGTLDSIPNTRVAAWRLASVSPPLRASIGASEARVPTRPPAFTRRVMLMAQPGWESKFVTAALEEAGWHIDGRYRVSPRAAVTLGAPGRLDTARYAVVVLLDSMPVDAAAIRRFVQQGGGVVLGGDALRIPALAPISPARATTVRGAVAGALLTDTPQRGLEAWELVANRGALSCGRTIRTTGMRNQRWSRSASARGAWWPVRIATVGAGAWRAPTTVPPSIARGGGACWHWRPVRRPRRPIQQPTLIPATPPRMPTWWPASVCRSRSTG